MTFEIIKYISLSAQTRVLFWRPFNRWLITSLLSVTPSMSETFGHVFAERQLYSGHNKYLPRAQALSHANSRDIETFPVGLVTGRTQLGDFSVSGMSKIKNEWIEVHVLFVGSPWIISNWCKISVRYLQSFITGVATFSSLWSLWWLKIYLPLLGFCWASSGSWLLYAVTKKKKKKLFFCN